MSKAHLNIIYDGEAVREGLMDVRDLAPALLSLGELFQHSNRILNGDKAKISVNVKAGIIRGSFELGIVLDQSLFKQALDLFRSTSIFSPYEIIELIFGPIGLVRFLKWAMGRKPEETKELKDNEIEVLIQGNRFITNNYVLNFYGEKDIRKSLDDTIRPLTKEGIDSLEVRKEREIMERIVKEEVSYIEMPRPEEVEDVFESAETGIYEVVKLSFTERYKWALTDGEVFFHADMEDRHFLERVKNREISFAKGDILKCEIRKKTKTTKEGLKPYYRIVKVLDVISSPKQMLLTEPPTYETEDSENQ